MSKKHFKETKKPEPNKESGVNVNSSITGATLQSSSESAVNGITKVLSNEQAIAAKDVPNAQMLSYTNYSTLEETEKFNARTAAIRDITKK